MSCNCNHNHTHSHTNNRCGCSKCHDSGCLKYVSTDCIQTTKSYSCLGTGAGDLLTEVLDQVEALCVTIGSISGGSCFTFTDISFPTPVANIQLAWDNFSPSIVPGFQTSQYSDIVGCVGKIRGQVYTFVTSTSYLDPVDGRLVSEITTIPSPPPVNRIYSVTVGIVNNSVLGDVIRLLPGYIKIFSTGIVQLEFYPDAGAVYTGSGLFVNITLDGIFYETSP